MRAKVLFYAVSDDYGAFSNFAPYPVTVRRQRWPTSEHFFRAQKFEDPKVREAIRREKSPTQAARIGRDRTHRLRRDWESVRLDVMREALHAKFTQYQDLRSLLLSTGDAKIVEHTERDDFWGDGGDGSGKNMLGRLLMELRDELRGDGSSVGGAPQVSYGSSGARGQRPQRWLAGRCIDPHSCSEISDRDLAREPLASRARSVTVSTVPRVD